MHTDVVAAADQVNADTLELNKSESDLNLPAKSNREIKIPEAWLPDVKKAQREDYLARKFPH